MIHYPFDFIVIIVALIFYYIGTTSSFESVYFRRATRINTKMRESLNNESKSSH
ncbi:Amino acid permease [Staphylococcus aureus]|nr:Amino acid permease [Staphylococcus aureus]